MRELKAKLRERAPGIAGGPGNYSEDRLYERHVKQRREGMTEAHFGIVARHLEETIRDAGFGPEVISQAMASILAYKDAVVGGGKYAERAAAERANGGGCPFGH